MRFVHLSGVALSLLVMAERSPAQIQPATIPTVVALAMVFQPSLYGTPRYFDGRTPTDWPAALIPPGVKVLGGGVVGDSATSSMQTAVFAFSAQSNPNEVVLAMLAQAGFAHPDLTPIRTVGGFVESGPSAPASRYCKGSVLATFGALDPVQAPGVIVVHLFEGASGRVSCTPQPDRMVPRRMPPVTLPTLTAPPGAKSSGLGSNWSGSRGSIESSLQTTMPADSILAHYTAQLVAAGWKTQGQPTLLGGLGAQRFTFREGQDDWTAVLFVMPTGDLREVMVHFAKLQ